MNTGNESHTVDNALKAGSERLRKSLEQAEKAGNRESLRVSLDKVRARLKVMYDNVHIKNEDR